MVFELRTERAAMDRPASVADRDDETEWLRRARAGDHAAYDWILTRYRQRAVRLATHVMRRPDDAEDVVQDAFVRAFRKLGTFRGDGSFYTWLYAIVVRECLNRLKVGRREPELRLFDMADHQDAFNAVETHVVIRSLLDRLSPRMRAALALRELEGLDYEEIAEVLGIAVGTVRSRLNAARHQFARMWQDAQQETNNV